MPPFTAAGAAEILRSSQKDEQYLQELRGNVADIIQRIAGIQRWIKCRQEINVLCDFSYFLITTISGLQTVGEEYVHIVQVDGSFRNVPSILRRAASVLIHTSGPLLIQLLLNKIERTLYQYDFPPNLGGEATKNLLLKWLPNIQYVFTLIHRFHLIAFYFYGAYYHLSKRFTGIKYVNLQRWLSQQHPPHSYRLLGWLTLIQLCTNLSLQVYSHFINKTIDLKVENIQQKLKRSDNTQVIPTHERCCLCLEKRQHTTATPCGHLFCWECIMEWLQTKRECPLCRDKVEFNQLVYLQNYQ